LEMRLVMNQGNEHAVYNKMVRAGEEFEVPDSEGEIWVKIGRAHVAEPEEQKRRGRYARRDMRVENTVELRSEDE